MKRYEYILKVADGSLWLKVKECIKSRGEVENLDIRYLDNGNVKFSFDSDNYEIIDNICEMETLKRVILCKDCKFYYPNMEADGETGDCKKAQWFRRLQYPNDFCSRAERKEE